MHTKAGQFQFFTHEERKLLIKGVDMASYQYSLDKDPNNTSVNGVQGYDVFKANKLDFVIMKAGSQHTSDEGYTADSQFTAQNVAEFRKRGLKVGTYYYARYINTKTLTSIYTSGYTDANLQAEATKEANNYANILENVFGAGQCGDILPVLDFEDNRLNSTYVMTPHQAFLWMKAFKDQMVVRFPQLSSRGGIMLYTAYYFIGDGCGGNVKHTDGTLISSVIPKLWWSANASDSGYHSAGKTNYDSYDYNMTTFGGYTKWVLWQYSTDRNRHGAEYLISTAPIDLDVLDTVNYTLNDILVYPETKPQSKKLLDGKADKVHIHIGEYLPLKNGVLEGATDVITPDAFYFKQEGNVSWKIGRMSADITTNHLAPEIAFIPSSDYYTPFSGVEAETWDTTKAIVFKADGSITCAGKIVLTDTTQYYTKSDVDGLLGTINTKNSTQDGRLDTLETDDTSNKNRLSTLEIDNSTNKSNISTLQSASHTHSNKSQIDLVPATLGTNGQVLKSNGTAMVWGTDNTVDLTANQSPTGTWIFRNGAYNFGKKIADNTGSSTDKYMILARLETTLDYQRAMFDMNLFTTGNKSMWSRVKAYLYSAGTYNTIASSSFCKIMNDDVLAMSLGDIKIVKKEATSKYYWDIYLKVYGYAEVFVNLNFGLNGGGKVTIDPDSGALLTALPALNDVQSIGGLNFTAKEVADPIIKAYTLA